MLLGVPGDPTWGSGPHSLGPCSPSLFLAAPRPQRQKEAPALPPPPPPRGIRRKPVKPENPNKIGRVKIVKGACGASRSLSCCDQLAPGRAGLIKLPSLWARGPFSKGRGSSTPERQHVVFQEGGFGCHAPPQTSLHLPPFEYPDRGGGEGRGLLGPHTWTSLNHSIP